MKKLSVVYFGTPDFSAALLEKLLVQTDLPIEIVGVITQPDRRVGRDRVITPTPVKLVALKHGISLNPDISTADLGLLFAYGEILTDDQLQMPRYGFWNVHPSLLPRYRGASPVATPLINGDVESGVTIIQMDSQLDHGPIILQRKTYIFPLERRDQLTDRLVDLSARMLGELFGNYAVNMEGLPRTTQNESGATYTKKLTKQDGFIDFASLMSQIQDSSDALFNRYRGLYPWPGIWTLFPTASASENGDQVEKRLKITKMHLENGKLVIKKVQLEGKNEVDFATFRSAYHASFDD